MIQKHPSLLPLIHRAGVVKESHEDPFIEEEQDPQKTKAMESSLWELQALESHFCPSVRTLSTSFHGENGLFAEMRVRKFNVEDYVEETYESIFEGELTAKAKRVALAFDKPQGLFPDTWAGGAAWDITA